jgi:tartrate/fumarate subfamily iron-sulfur-dependent hydro-lyase beta chain
VAKLIDLRPPLSDKKIEELKVGDIVSLSGTIVTARDKAYARALDILRSGKKLPIDMRNGIVYHCGPLVKKTPRGPKIVSAGPTTSARLDDMQIDFVRLSGVKALIGKSGVGKDVAPELARSGCIYLAFTGGAGVLASQSIERVKKILWRDLGPIEGLWVLDVKKFGPLVVAIDVHGGNLYLRR